MIVVIGAIVGFMILAMYLRCSTSTRRSAISACPSSPERSGRWAAGREDLDLGAVVSVVRHDEKRGDDRALRLLPRGIRLGRRAARHPPGRHRRRSARRGADGLLGPRSGPIPRPRARMPNERRLSAAHEAAAATLLWRAAFALPVEIVEDPLARFALRGPHGVPVALPAPALRTIALRRLALREAPLERTGRLAATPARRRAVALATAAALTATSTPAAAFAASVTPSSTGPAPATSTTSTTTTPTTSTTPASTGRSPRPTRAGRARRRPPATPPRRRRGRRPRYPRPRCPLRPGPPRRRARQPLPRRPSPRRPRPRRRRARRRRRAARGPRGPSCMPPQRERRPQHAAHPTAPKVTLLGSQPVRTPPAPRRPPVPGCTTGGSPRVVAVVAGAGSHRRARSTAKLDCTATRRSTPPTRWPAPRHHAPPPPRAAPSAGARLAGPAAARPAPGVRGARQAERNRAAERRIAILRAGIRRAFRPRVRHGLPPPATPAGRRPRRPRRPRGCSRDTEPTRRPHPVADRARLPRPDGVDGRHDGRSDAHRHRPQPVGPACQRQPAAVVPHPDLPRGEPALRRALAGARRDQRRRERLRTRHQHLERRRDRVDAVRAVDLARVRGRRRRPQHAESL